MDKRRKELLFLAAGLAILLIALYFTFKPTTPAAEATPQPPAASAVAHEPPPQPSARIQASAVLVPMSQGGTTAGRNPFAPVIAARPAAPPLAAPPPMLAQRPLLPPLRPVPLGGFPGLPGASGPSVITPVQATAPSDAPLRLTGVIYGDPPMAIIRKGEKRYFVRPGDPVGSRYVVQSISHRRVVLRLRGRRSPASADEVAASSRYSTESRLVGAKHEQETLSLDLRGRL